MLMRMDPNVTRWSRDSGGVLDEGRTTTRERESADVDGV